MHMSLQSAIMLLKLLQYEGPKTIVMKNVLAIFISPVPVMSLTNTITSNCDSQDFCIGNIQFPGITTVTDHHMS